MAQASARFARLFLRVLKRRMDRDQTPLADLLLDAAEGQVQSVAGGIVLVATSGNGHQHSYQLDPSLGPRDVADMVSDLLDRHDAAVAELTGADDNDVYREMMDRLEPVDAVEQDYSLLRGGREGTVA